MRYTVLGFLMSVFVSGCVLFQPTEQTLMDIAVYKYGIYVPADPQNSDTYTAEKRAEDNWACQQQHSQWTADGYHVDELQYHQCMVKRGWKKVFVTQ